LIITSLAGVAGATIGTIFMTKAVKPENSRKRFLQLFY